MVSGVNFIDFNLKNKAKQKTYEEMPPKARARVISDHINYIARIEGAANNGEHSLFGTLQDNDNVSELPKSEILSYIRDKVKNGAYVYKTVISLTQEDAEKYGYIDKEATENLVRNNISNIAKEYNIKFEDLDFVASFHTEEGHPHIHLVFYDKNNERSSIPFVKYDNIKKELNKTVYREELEPIYKVQNKARDSIKDIFKEELDNLSIISKNTLFNNKVDKDTLMKVKNGLELILEAKKKEYKETGKGSFRLQYQSEDMKQLIRNVTSDIIKSSNSIKENINQYVSANIEAEKIRTANLSKKKLLAIQNNSYEEMYKKIDNLVLDFVKEQRLKEQKLEKNYFTKKYQTKDFYNQRSKYILRGLSNLYMLINRLTKQDMDLQKYINRKTLKSNLTKAARREWYLKNRDNNIIKWNDEEI